MNERPSRPIPIPSLDSADYWAALAEHRLTAPKCEECGAMWFPPGGLCPQCGSNRSVLVDVSGRGRVYSFVIVHRVYHPAFAEDVPYPVALVELEEGPRMLSNVVGVDPSEIRCDMPVEVVFDDVADGVTIPRFAPLDANRSASSASADRRART